MTLVFSFLNFLIPSFLNFLIPSFFNSLIPSFLKSHQFKTPRTAHIYTHNEPTDKTEYIWFVAHGYGQLASSIIRKLMHLEEQHYVVSVEALSRFYFSFEKQIVGASWMTKNDRFDEIDDINHYLDSVYAQFVTANINPNTKIIFLGFSQGGICIARWMSMTKPRCDHFISWGSALPDDVDYYNPEITGYFKSFKTSFICGTNDEFFYAERMDKYTAFLAKLPFKVEHISFEGKHEILVPVLDAYFETHIQ